MKLKIKYIVTNPLCVPVQMEQGDLVDLVLAEDIKDMKKFELKVFSLGVAVELPKGFIAKIYSRSSTPVKHGIIVPNSVGIIDNSYHGDEDVWKLPVMTVKTGVNISAGTRVCQCHIMLSPKAGIITKLKWLFSSGFRWEEVKTLQHPSRGGFGSTDES